MMAPGYEEGFGLIKGVAIDQHMLTRNRQDDLEEVVAKHPEVLGIGLDESTAIVVRGQQFEVIGASKIAIHDGRIVEGRAGAQRREEEVLLHGPWREVTTSPSSNASASRRRASRHDHDAPLVRPRRRPPRSASRRGSTCARSRRRALQPCATDARKLRERIEDAQHLRPARRRHLRRRRQPRRVLGCGHRGPRLRDGADAGRRPPAAHRSSRQHLRAALRHGERGRRSSSARTSTRSRAAATSTATSGRCPRWP